MNKLEQRLELDAAMLELRALEAQVELFETQMLLNALRDLSDLEDEMVKLTKYYNDVEQFHKKLKREGAIRLAIDATLKAKGA